MALILYQKHQKATLKNHFLNVSLFLIKSGKKGKKPTQIKAVNWIQSWMWFTGHEF